MPLSDTDLRGGGGQKVLLFFFSLLIETESHVAGAGLHVAEADL